MTIGPEFGGQKPTDASNPTDQGAGEGTKTPNGGSLGPDIPNPGIAGEGPGKHTQKEVPEGSVSADTDASTESQPLSTQTFSGILKEAVRISGEGVDVTAKERTQYLGKGLPPDTLVGKHQWHGYIDEDGMRQILQVDTFNESAILTKSPYGGNELGEMNLQIVKFQIGTNKASSQVLVNTSFTSEGKIHYSVDEIETGIDSSSDSEVKKVVNQWGIPMKIQGSDSLDPLQVGFFDEAQGLRFLRALRDFEIKFKQEKSIFLKSIELDEL